MTRFSFLAAPLAVLGLLIAGSQPAGAQQAPRTDQPAASTTGEKQQQPDRKGQWQGRRKGGGPPAGDGRMQGRRKGGDGPPAGAKRSGRGGGGPGGRRGRGRRGGPTFVSLDAVIEGPISETVPIYGRLVARQMGVVAARVRGPVATIRAFIGNRVKVGDVLAILATDRIEAERDLKAAELTEFDARVKSARSQMKLAQQELKRLKRLRRSPAFSQARYDDKRQEVERYRSGLGEAKAKVKQAQAELRMAEIDLHNATVRAPFSGVVIQRHTDVGSFLNVGDRVVTMINDAALEIEAEIPSARLQGLRRGTVIRAEFEDKTPFVATVRAIVPMENALSRTRTVRFSPGFDRNGMRIAVNQSVRLLVPVGAPRTVVSVHKDAILQRDGRPVVFIVVGKKAMIRPVKLGGAVGGRFVVLGGLKPGDRVVVRGNERLRPGQAIRERRGGPA